MDDFNIKLVDSILRLSVKVSLCELQLENFGYLLSKNPLSPEDKKRVTEKAYENLTFLSDIMPKDEILLLIEQSLTPRDNTIKKDNL